MHQYASLSVIGMQSEHTVLKCSPSSATGQGYKICPVCVSECLSVSALTGYVMTSRDVFWARIRASSLYSTVDDPADELKIGPIRKNIYKSAFFRTLVFFFAGGRVGFRPKR